MDDPDLKSRLVMKAPLIIRNVLEFKDIPRPIHETDKFYKVLREDTVRFLNDIFVGLERPQWDPLQVSPPFHRCSGY